METALLVVVVLLLASLVIVVGLASKTVSELRRSVASLEGRLEGLRGDLARYEQRLEAVRAAQARRTEEPVVAAFEAFRRYRSRGWLTTIVAVGARFLGSYLRDKNQVRALPGPKKRG